MLKTAYLYSIPIFFMLYLITFYNAKTVLMQAKPQTTTLNLFLCGDVMTGRGIDQILPNPVHPVLFESYVKDARDYVSLASQKNGNIHIPVSFKYIWGDALKIWDKMSPDLKIINLETAVTTHPKPWLNKGINYRMNPENIEILKVANIDFCSLANNHTLDWQSEGLLETLQILKNANIHVAGAGINKESASKPSIISLNQVNVIVLAYGTESSGILTSWEATNTAPGLNLLPTNTEAAVQQIKNDVEKIKKTNDIVIISIHWGGNWGYEIPENHKLLAHKIIETAGVDLIHGHSSHHPLGIEVYQNKLILYGAGDFINDYEGISGHENFKGELSLMYFPQINPSNGHLLSLKMFPMKTKNFRLVNVSNSEALWIKNMLNREGKPFGTGVILNSDHSMDLWWN